MNAFKKANLGPITKQPTAYEIYLKNPITLLEAVQIVDALKQEGVSKQDAFMAFPDSGATISGKNIAFINSDMIMCAIEVIYRHTLDLPECNLETEHEFQVRQALKLNGGK